MPIASSKCELGSTEPEKSAAETIALKNCAAGMSTMVRSEVCARAIRGIEEQPPASGTDEDSAAEIGAYEGGVLEVGFREIGAPQGGVVELVPTRVAPLKFAPLSSTPEKSVLLRSCPLKSCAEALPSGTSSPSVRTMMYNNDKRRIDYSFIGLAAEGVLAAVTLGSALLVASWVP